MSVLGLTAVQEDVRKHAARLLGTPEDGKLAKKVTKAEADAYDSVHSGPPCVADNFKLHLDGTPAHPWNKAATKVFVASFCTKYPQHSPDEAGKHFKVHLETLIRKYRTQQRLKDNPEATEAVKKQNRKTARKVTVSPFLFGSMVPSPDCAQLFEDRMKMMRTVPELRRHESIIDSLGCAGMSSDETSVESGVKIYRAKKKYWRAPELEPFLHMIDRVTEKTKNATSSRGSTKYLRLPSNKVSKEGAIVPHLPINLYDREWLVELHANMKPVYDWLNVKHEVYPLVHDPVIQR